MNNLYQKVKEYFNWQTPDKTGVGRSEDSREYPSTSAPPPERVERPQPVLQNAGYAAAGGVQGLEWYKKGLKQDSDGDVADEFWEESSDAAHAVQEKAPALQVQSKNLRAAPVRQLSVTKGRVEVKS